MGDVRGASQNALVREAIVKIAIGIVFENKALGYRYPADGILLLAEGGDKKTAVVVQLRVPHSIVTKAHLREDRPIVAKRGVRGAVGVISKQLNIGSPQPGHRIEEIFRAGN